MSAHPEDRLICHRCGAVLTPGEGSFWIVRIDAVCDPAPPRVDPDESMTDIAADWNRLIDEMRDLSEQELLDQVSRRITAQVCAPCFRAWIEQPFG
jgi:hypothetical protein